MIHNISNEIITFGIDTLQIDLAISQEAQELIDESAIETNDYALINYVITDNGLKAENLKKILSSNTLEAQYTGHADSHSIEVLADGEYQTFQLSSKVQTQFITKRITDEQIIKFDYVELEHGQKLITDLYTE